MPAVTLGTRHEPNSHFFGVANMTEKSVLELSGNLTPSTVPCSFLTEGLSKLHVMD